MHDVFLGLVWTKDFHPENPAMRIRYRERVKVKGINISGVGKKTPSIANLPSIYLSLLINATKQSNITSL